jgi:hypothetical protein
VALAARQALHGAVRSGVLVTARTHRVRVVPDGVGVGRACRGRRAAVVVAVVTPTNSIAPIEVVFVCNRTERVYGT